MNPKREDNYITEFLGTWPVEDPVFGKLRMLAEEYHILCERFDQAHCRHRNSHGIAIPITGMEILECQRNAKNLFGMLKCKACGLGFSGERFLRTVSSIQIHSMDDLRQLERRHQEYYQSHAD